MRRVPIVARASIKAGRSYFPAASLATTAMSAAVKLFFALMTQSALVFINALYNVLLCVPRVSAIAASPGDASSASESGPSDAPGRTAAPDAIPALVSAVPSARTRHRAEAVTAASVILLGAAFLAYSNHALVNGDSFTLGKIAAISFATCGFVKIGVATYGIVKEWGSKDGMVFACKVANLSDALASIVLTQMALLGIGGRTETGEFASSAFGIVVGIAIIAMGAWLLARSLHGRAGRLRVLGR